MKILTEEKYGEGADEFRMQWFSQTLDVWDRTLVLTGCLPPIDARNDVWLACHQAMFCVNSGLVKGAIYVGLLSFPSGETPNNWEELAMGKMMEADAKLRQRLMWKKVLKELVEKYGTIQQAVESLK